MTSTQGVGLALLLISVIGMTVGIRLQDSPEARDESIGSFCRATRKRFSLRGIPVWLGYLLLPFGIGGCLVALLLLFAG